MHSHVHENTTRHKHAVSNTAIISDNLEERWREENR